MRKQIKWLKPALKNRPTHAHLLIPHMLGYTEKLVRFISKWRTAVGSDTVTWKYPTEWEKWSYREARAIFHTYCGRTDIDPRYETEVTKCKCDNADLSSNHIISQCRNSRELDSRLDADTLPPTFNKEMVLDKEWGPKIRNFLRKTRLGMDQI
jgi:hypothetical protein